MISLLFYELFETIQREKILEHDFKSQFLDIEITNRQENHWKNGEKIKKISIGRAFFLKKTPAHNFDVPTN